MKNYELFQRNPKTANLVNDGQARIVDSSESAKALDMLRYELEHFVCEGQYGIGLQRILDSYLTNLSSASQRAAWVSGFYGSGKSHLLKMLSHLWENTELSDGATARSIVPDLPGDVVAHLRELDNQGKRYGGGVFAVSGTMPEGSTESARLTVLGIMLRAAGLPAAYNQARFCLYLQDQGYFDAVCHKVESAGRDFYRELRDLYVSRPIREALLESDPGLGSESEVRQLLRDQFPSRTDIDTAEFIRMAREVLTLAGKGEIPLTAVILDEVQHYIGDDKDRSREITELTEALNKQMSSRVLVVAAGQNALSTDTPQFAWLRGRFTIPVELSDADVETVTRKVLLAKKPEAISTLEAELEKHAGEIERQLVQTNIAPTARDREYLVPDYPILPTRRRFWEEALRAVDPTGSSSLLRSQLRITHEALRQVADQPLGHVIPGDFMFFQQQTALVQQGALSREVSDRILRLDDGSDKGRLMARICGLVYLIRKLSREKGVDTGIRATSDMLADLLVEDLSEDGAKLRRDLPSLLEELVQQGVVLYDGKEYGLQTREFAEWDDQFRTHLAKIRQDTAAISQERKSRLRAAVDAAVKGIKLRQGTSQTPREILIHFGEDPPEITGKAVPVWVRDGWETGKNDVIGTARKAGADSPTLFVFLPKSQEESLRENIIRMKAAQAVLELKGVPASREAEEARDAMDSRQRDAARNVQQSVQEILGAAQVFKGGGAELHPLELRDKIEDGAADALTRLFPRFNEADSKAWEVVIRRARNGDDSPLQAIEWTGTTEEHPVCREILRLIGPGKEGRHIRAELEKPPYGWPRDAVDAGLVALHTSGHLLAVDTRTNESIQPRHLDQNRIPKASFRTESVTLKRKDQIALRGLLQSGGLSVRQDEDLNAKAGEYLDHLIALAKSAGGPAPLPEPPATGQLEDLKRYSGNERLAKLLEQQRSLQQQAGDWKRLADLAKKRWPVWERLQELLERCGGKEEVPEVQNSAEAIRNDRLLLETTDHVGPLVKKATDALRSKLTDLREAYSKVREEQMSRLENADVWSRLTGDQKDQLLKEHPIPPLGDTPMGTEEELLATLRQTPLSTWRDRIDALPGRVDSLLNAAAKLLEPKSQKVALPSATIHNAEELDAWLQDARNRIEEKLKEGPVIL